MKRLKEMKTVVVYTLVCFTITISGGCAKDFLEVKPNQKMVVPSTLKDFQALLDNTDKMNIQMPYLIETASDDFYLTYDRYSSISVKNERMAYIWEVNSNYTNNESHEWNNRYAQVFYANIVNENIAKLLNNSDKELLASTLKGSALFYRSWAYWQLAQMFCKPYSVSADKDLGLPLRLSADINNKTVRASLKQTYLQIISDLNESINYLPDLPTLVTRPSKAASYALLSRVYLSMENYEACKNAAESCLKLKDDLIDFSLLDETLRYPFPQFNKEVIFHSLIQAGLSLRENRLIVDTVLFKSYDDLDLRKKMFFYVNGGVRYKGSYSGKQDFFCGLATNEVLLNLAESYLRIDHPEKAKDILLKLLVNRYDTSYPFALSNDKEGLLLDILRERRKELIFRGIRWMDLRRLNLDSRFEKTIIRHLNGEIYTLEPNSNKYVFPIPQNVIEMTGIQQNP